MLSLPPSTKIFLCSEAVDMRKSFDALSGLVTTHFGQNPLCGHLFVFFGRRRDCMKVLLWDLDGCATRSRSNMNGIKLPREPPFPVLT